MQAAGGVYCLAFYFYHGCPPLLCKLQIRSLSVWQLQCACHNATMSCCLVYAVVTRCLVQLTWQPDFRLILIRFCASLLIKSAYAMPHTGMMNSLQYTPAVVAAATVHYRQVGVTCTGWAVWPYNLLCLRFADAGHDLQRGSWDSTVPLKHMWSA